MDYITNTLERCSLPSTKKKRGLSGYNCFIKVAIKKSGKPLKEVVQAKGWSTLEDKQKSVWKDLALDGCSPKLYENETGIG